MKNWFKKYRFLCLAVLLGIGFMSFFYGKAMWNPNEYLFSDKGDGVKNAYTYTYHIKNDSSWLNFEGMNYPYGEQVVYPDLFPLLTLLMRPFSQLHPYSIGVFNSVMIWSKILEILFLFLVLKWFKIRDWPSLLGALAIAFLSPQIFRLTGHYALGISFFIPMGWYFMLRFRKSTRPWFWCLLMALLIVLLLFAHPYLGVILAMFYALSGLVMIWRERAFDKIRLALQVFLFAILPLVLYQSFVSLTDIHLDRHKIPYGFFSYHTSFEAVFLPHRPPFGPLLHSIFKGSYTGGGGNYIGLGSLIVLTGLVFTFLRKIRKGDWKTDRGVFKENDFWMYIFAALIMLFYAMCLPFKWNMEFLAEWFPLIQRFRSIGRFSWVFYYVITTFSFVLVGRYFGQSAPVRWKKIGVLGLVFGLFVIESISYHQHVSSIITRTRNPFDSKNLEEDRKSLYEGVSPEDFQAILPLPFYHFGSEDFSKKPSKMVYMESQLLSFYTGLPLISSATPHCSRSEAKKILGLLAPDFYEKGVFEDFNSKKDLLIYWTGEKLNDHEKDLLEFGKLIGESKKGKIYSISIDELKRGKKRQAVVSTFQSMGADSSGLVYYDNCEKRTSGVSFRGKGAQRGRQSEFNLIADLEGLHVDSNYSVSFWYRYEGMEKPKSSLFVKEVIEDGEMHKIKIANTSDAVVFNRGWALVEFDFKPENGNATHRIFLKGDERKKDSIYVDEVLVRKEGAEVFWLDKESEAIFWNDHLLPLKP